MNKKTVISLMLILSVTLGVSGCGNKQKTSVLTNDVKKEAAMQETEVKKIIADGTKLLNEGKYDDARNTFEKAISMDKANKATYLEIKNKYMEKQRIDDAYYIIKLAMGNNVDTENMKELLKDIKSKFQVTKLDVTVNQNSSYSLPNKIKANINNEEKEVDVVWKDTNVDTSKVGTKKYEGKIDKYDRIAELTIKVVKSEKPKKFQNETKIGGISKVYEKDGKRYLKFDEVEFFLDKDPNDQTAEREARKDGEQDAFDPETGRVYDSYYIRNKDRSLATYEVSPNVEIYVCGWTVGVETINKQKISYERFKRLNMKNGLSYNGILCHIYIENNVVVKIEQQYIP